MIDGQNFFDQKLKYILRTYDNIKKNAVSQVNHYTTDCLLDYKYFHEYYKMNTIDLSKQQALDAYRNAIQQISFTGNLIHKINDGQDINVNTTMFFVIEEAKETISDFSQGTVKVL